jgi:hypothetical protein
MFSKSQLAGIGHIAKRARFEAEKAGRTVRLDDVKSAIQRRMPIDAEYKAPAASLPSSRNRPGKVQSLAAPMFDRDTVPALVEKPRIDV